MTTFERVDKDQLNRGYIVIETIYGVGFVIGFIVGCCSNKGEPGSLDSGLVGRFLFGILTGIGWPYFLIAILISFIFYKKNNEL